MTYLETVDSGEDIDSGDANERLKLSAVVLFEKGEHWENTFRVNQNL
jgi:hypothetical protein